MRRTALSLSLVLALAGCAQEESPSAASGRSEPAAVTAHADDAPLPAEAAALLDGYAVEGLGVKATIEHLDRLDEGRPLDVQASVRADEVILSRDGREVAVPIPGDEVYVSVAPYVNRTHECTYHALGGCQGEMVGEKVHVTVTDGSGAVLADQDATTYSNGFVGLWLPRDTSGTISVTQGSREGSTSFDTGADGLTCVTTLQLG